MSSDSNPELLLRELSWVRALARRLVADAQEAEDLAQDALVAAVERGGAFPGRAWLGGVLRNLARQRRRAARRRSVREERAARAERLDPASEIVARSELERRVLRAVLALAEPTRSTLLLRYHDGLAPRAIARRLELPVETVQSRLRRGLRALRAELAGERDDGLQGLAFLLPLAAPGAGPAAPLAGALAVNAKPIALAAALALSLALLVARPWSSAVKGPRSNPAEIARVEEPTADEPAAPAATPPVTDPRVALDSPPATTAPTAPATALAGRVVARGDGRPVPGAEVRVTLRQAGERRELVLRADDAGAFRAELGGAAWLEDAVIAAGPDHAGGARRLARLAPAEVTTSLELAVARGGALIGRVVDEAGEPIPDATVRAWCTAEDELYEPWRAPQREVRADGDGRFRVEALAGSFHVDALAPGYAPALGLRGEWAGLEADTVEAAGLELMLAPERFVEGRALDETGAPVAGVEVACDAHGSRVAELATSLPGVERFRTVRARATADAAGRFRLGPLPPGAWPVDALHDGYVAWHGLLEPEQRELDLRLLRGGLARGRVLDLEGRPLAGAEVRAFTTDRPRRAVRTDAEGRFALAGVAEGGPLAVAVRAPGHALDALAPWPTDGEERELRLGPARPLAGVVLDSNGAPVPGASVRIAGERALAMSASYRAPLEQLFGLWWTRADEAGRFRFEHLYDGVFEVAVSPPDGQLDATRFELRAGELDAVLRLAPEPDGLMIVGRVTDARTGRPVERFTVAPMQPVDTGWEGLHHEYEGTDGRYRVPGVEPGRLWVEVSAPGYATWRSPELAAEPGELPLDAALEPAVGLRFRLVAAPGTQRPADLAASFETLDGRPIDTNRGRIGGSIFFVGEDVERVAGLPDARVRLVLVTPIVDRAHRRWTLELEPARPGEGVRDLVVDYAAGETVER